MNKIATETQQLANKYRDDHDTSTKQNSLIIADLWKKQQIISPNIVWHSCNLVLGAGKLQH